MRVRTLGGRVLAAGMALSALLAAPGTATAAPAAPAAPAADPVPPGDAFYTPPDPLPAGAPGDVIRFRPSPAGPPTARRLADAWQVMYLSTDGLGRPDAVTGTILVPKGADRATAPVIGFGPGTSGPAFRCAPSTFIAGGAFYEQAALNEMLQAGYAVAVTDYEGYHAAPTSTYMTGRSMGPALMDAVRAAQRLPDAGLSKDAPVVFRGYSQGGGAAMWAGQLQPSYAPELKLAGVVGGGVPANLALVALGLEGKKPFGFLLDALIGLDNAYPELQLDSYLNDEGRAAVAGMEQNDCTLVGDYFTRNPLGTAPWAARVTENRLGGAPIKVPVLQYHSDADEIVAFGQAKTLRGQYCAQGVPLTWKVWNGLSHITLVYRGDAEAMAFIADRLAGRPATPNCAPTPSP